MTKMLSPLFELDPLFRRTFLLCVPPEAFGKLATSGLFPPVELYVTLAMVLAGKKFIKLDEVNLSYTLFVSLIKLSNFAQCCISQ